jgi:hypothetical protein
MTEKNKQLTIEEKWAKDGLPNVTEPTEETLAYVAWFREQDEKKKKTQDKSE